MSNIIIYSTVGIFICVHILENFPCCINITPMSGNPVNSTKLITVRDIFIQHFSIKAPLWIDHLDRLLI